MTLNYQPKSTRPRWCLPTWREVLVVFAAILIAAAIGVLIRFPTLIYRSSLRVDARSGQVESSGILLGMRCFAEVRETAISMALPPELKNRTPSWQLAGEREPWGAFPNYAYGRVAADIRLIGQCYQLAPFTPEAKALVAKAFISHLDQDDPEATRWIVRRVEHVTDKHNADKDGPIGPESFAPGG